tara:strand:- start:524 stop:775 length:252 start_codon:yes stop_codon:yes gene_type:complete
MAVESTGGDSVDDDDMEETVWKAIGAYVQQYGLVRHQIESYENFVQNVVRNIVQDHTDISLKDPFSNLNHHIQFCNVSMQMPR